MLELYAAGGLTPAESAEVDQMAAQHPQVRLALEECLRAMEAYALTHAKAPRPELEDHIIRQMEAVTAPRPETAHPQGRVLPFDSPVAGPTNLQPANRWWQMAAAVLLVLSVGANVFLYSTLQNTRSALALARQDSRQYALQVHQLEQRNLQSENLLGVLRNPNTLAVPLKGVEQHPGAQATVFWNQETKEVYFDASGLPQAPTGRQYQLWALAKGKPVDAGLVKPADSTLQRMKTVAEAQAFAVTLEPEGGSVNPTLEQMYVMGTSPGR